MLGATLACAHSSIRFGDAQRVCWGSLQLSAQGLRATAYATKTTKAGQRFFCCAWHGISGRNAQSSGLLHWLAALASIPKALFDADNGTVEPDFLFPCIDMQCLSIAYSSACAGQPHPIRGKRSHPAQHEVHGAGVGRAAASFSRRQASQGHRRDIARLYSGNDTFASLHIQRRIALALADGWQPQRSMPRGGCAPVAEPPFSAPRAHPPGRLSASDLLNGPWQISVGPIPTPEVEGRLRHMWAQVGRVATCPSRRCLLAGFAG